MEETAFEVSDILSGEAEVVNTSSGPIYVSIFGDRSKSPCLAYHEVGLNHRTCFHSLVVTSGPRSLLLKNFYVIFINAPGCEVSIYRVEAMLMGDFPFILKNIPLLFTGLSFYLVFFPICAGLCYSSFPTITASLIGNYVYTGL